MKMHFKMHQNVAFRWQISKFPGEGTLLPTSTTQHLWRGSVNGNPGYAPAHRY